MNLILFVTLVVFPWWVFLFVSLVALFRFKNFYEILLWAFTADILFGVPVAMFYGFSFFFTLSALLALVAIEAIRPRLRTVQ